MAPPDKPHDALFRALLDRPERAAALIRHHLPPGIAARLAPDPPQPLEGTFIDPELRESRSDRLFQATLTDGRPALLYVLLEHKSAPDPGTPLQLLGYMVRIWQRHAGREAERLRALPPIVPLVFYHGREAWTVPASVLDCLDADPALMDALADFRYLLRDLGPIPYAELASDRAVRAALGALKYAFASAVGREVLARLLADLPDGELLEVQVLRYIARVFDTSVAEIGAALELAKPERKETLMPTAAQEWVQQGRAEGLVEGALRGQSEMLLRLMRRRFGAVPASAEARVRAADAAQLDRWSEAILDAPSLDDLLAEGSPH